MDPFPAAPPPHVAGDPWAPRGPRPTDGFAIASLVTGVIGLGAVALALGIVGLQRVRRTGAAGRGMAVAGIVLGAVGLLAGLAVAVAFAFGAAVGIAELVRTQAGSSAADSSRVLIDDLAVGDCLDWGDPEDTEAVQGVDCADGHQAEVVDVTTLPGAGAYPGEAVVGAAADARCSDVVEGALRAAGAATTTATYDYFLPSQDAWEAGDHEVRCLVTSGDDADLTGSLTGGTLDAPPAPSV